MYRAEKPLSFLPHQAPQCMYYTHGRCVHACSVVSDSATPRTVARQASLFMGFLRQEYWNGLPFPPPGNFHEPGIEPKSLASPALAGRFFTTEPPGSPILPNTAPLLDTLIHLA